MLLLASADFSNFFFKKYLSGTLSECLMSLDPDQDPQSVCPNLGSNCLERLIEDNKSGPKERIKALQLTYQHVEVQ